MIETCILIVLLASYLQCGDSKVFEIFHRDQFHDFAQDLPVNNRYHSIVAFYNESRECQRNLDSMNFNANELPSIEYLLMGKYEMSTFNKRVWYEKEDHLDMAKYMGITDYINKQESCECPLIVFIPSTYMNDIGDDYLSNPSINDIKIYEADSDENRENNIKNWRQWAWFQMKQKIRIIQTEPYDLEVTVLRSQDNPLLKEETDFTQIYELDASLSHLEVIAWPGDEIFISENPTNPNFLKQKRKRNKERKHNINPREPDNEDVINGNPIYSVFPEMRDIFVTELESGNFGFETGRREGIYEQLVKQRHTTTYTTHTRNLVLPLVLPHNDKLGFTKIKMPDGLHQRLLRFYRDWYHERVRESWEDTGTQLNFFDVKSHMVSLDHNFRERNSIANDVVKQLLMEWNGGIDLEFTAFYGIREYSRGAVLRNHVDRVDTHVYSVVLQVGQSGIDTDWPLEVIGFDGKRYEITLEPGEMILYEGHGLIHGRPAPFNGTVFSNAFCHFKPKGWDWTTNKVWRSSVAQETLKTMHVTLRDIYR